MRVILPLILIILFILAISLFLVFYSKPQTLDIPQEQEVVQMGEPDFEWNYISFEKEEIPQTTINLVAKYPDGATKSKEIDTIAGGCNEYDNRDSDVYEKSEMIICYYAGLGHYYKVVEQDGKHLVQTRVFEEASPDYDPPVEEFKTVLEF